MLRDKYLNVSRYSVETRCKLMLLFREEDIFIVGYKNPDRSSAASSLPKI